MSSQKTGASVAEFAREIGPAVLVTGGAGYIGSHTAKALSEAGFQPVAFDNLSAGHRESVRWGPLIHGDIRDYRAVSAALETSGAKAIIHFASLIEVGRSVRRPDLFYDVNVTGTAVLLAAARAHGAQRLIFSSSAAVYGEPRLSNATATLSEDDAKSPSSPYGETKLAAERMIASHCAAFGLSAVALRYFNAAGADPSGLIGEAHDPETHLIPLAIRAAMDEASPLTVFGDDFHTPDGSCIRDYIHVNDLAVAHVRALTLDMPAGRFEAINVGTGAGQSVLDVLSAVTRTLGRPARHQIGSRRAGDPAVLVADPSRAKALLGWEPKASLDDIVSSAAAWHARGHKSLARTKTVEA